MLLDRLGDWSDSLVLSNVERQSRTKQQQKDAFHVLGTAGQEPPSTYEIPAFKALDTTVQLVVRARLPPAKLNICLTLVDGHSGKQISSLAHSRCPSGLQAEGSNFGLIRFQV